MPTVNESLRDEAIAHSVWISRYATGVANRMVKLLNETDADLSARLLDALDRLPADSFTVTRLESLLGSVRELNHQAVASMQTGLERELMSLAQSEVSYQLSLFDSLLPSQVLEHYPLQTITADMVYAAAMAQPFQGRLLSEWADNLESDRLSRIVNAVRRGYLAGDTVETIARNVRGHANKDYRDGSLQMSRANAASIAKTAVNHLAATARNSFTSANSDIVKGKQWLSTLDNKTSHDCIIRDLLRYTLDNKPIGHKVPYLQGPGKIHFCCRSTETLILKSWRELGIDIDEMDDGTRASMDGQVPAKTTYLEWLARQSAQRQDQVLGAERGRLYRAGEIDLADMFTDKGEWISLERLKQLSGTDN
ncbi:phage minor head protein [Enterobacter asburiae]|uniref:phage minor head protein n=1 Tax=Enterobacter asburiae TaxID=61645 RepID=UPI00287956B9|nr:phage minor head protein [Enterobacter asburiae]MDS1916117.1 phage minor head protein [Enterobacter asburiae]